MEEIWKDIKDYEGYQVSNLGRVKSLRFKNSYREGILKNLKDDKGYFTVALSKSGKEKRCSVHRLVAQAFIPNTDNLPCVNHKDEVKTNNHVDNLEWCTQKYNVNYGTSQKRKGEKRRKKVYQYTLDGEFVREWKSVSEIDSHFKCCSSNISKCCRNKKGRVYGYIWSYEPLDKPSCQERIVVKRQNNKLSKKVYQYTLEGELIREWVSISEVKRQLNYDSSSISKCCLGKLRTVHGYIWSYEYKMPDEAQ